MGRFSWLKSIPPYYTLFHCVIGILVLPPVTTRDLLKSGADHTADTRGEQEVVCWCGTCIRSHQSWLVTAEKLLRLKKNHCKGAWEIEQAWAWLLLVSLKVSSPQIQGGSVGVVGQEASSPAKILVSNVCVGRVCCGRLPWADMRDDIGD